MSFEDHLNILAYFHLVEHPSGPQLLQVLMEEHFAQQHIAPLRGIEKSSFFCLHKMIKQDTSLLPPDQFSDLKNSEGLPSGWHANLQVKHDYLYFAAKALNFAPSSAAISSMSSSFMIGQSNPIISFMILFDHSGI